MTISYKMTLGGAMLSTLLVVSSAASAKQETGGEAHRYIDQVLDLTCQDGYQAWQSEICTGAQMRWRLCAMGFGAETLPNPEIYRCFVRSQ